MTSNLLTYKLTELVENIVDNRGKTCPTAEMGIPLIATNCIRNEKLYPDFINVRYVSDETYENWFRDHPKPEDLLFVLKGTPGRVCWTPNPINFCIAQDMVALRAKKGLIHPKYLFALLRSPIAQNKINALHVGSLIPHFKKTDFDKLELPVFEDINYQKEIGNIYFDICDKIENNLAINKTIEEMAMALYKHWFVDFGPFQDGEFVESELGMIPKGWAVSKLDEFANILNAQRVPLSSNQRSKRKGEYPYYGASGIIDYIDDFIFNGEYVLISEDGENLRSRNTPIAFIAFDKFWVNNHAHIIEGNKKGLNELIICHFAQLDMNHYLTGAVQPKLNKQNLLSIGFAMPKDMTSITKVLGELDFYSQLRLLNIKENQALTQLRDTLLPKLISGEVRLKEFQEQLATIL